MQVNLLEHTPNPERLIETAARVCYQSQSKGAPGPFIRKLIKRGHESVLEHASATFLISGISRACSHQLVRHRLASYSQKSQRYVEEDCWFHIIEPQSITAQRDAYVLYYQAAEICYNAYQKMRKMGIPKEDARMVLPQCWLTELVMTANFREWRHILKLRLDKAAQWEIREVAGRVLQELKQIAPNVFYDLEVID